MAKKASFLREKYLSELVVKNLCERRGKKLKKKIITDKTRRPVRLKNRCRISGHKRGYYRKFKVSRFILKEYASKGLIPGLRLSRW